MTSKQRAYLRGLANTMEPIVHVGKGGMAPTIEKQADDALTARELIKGRVLETAPLTAKEAAAELAQATASQGSASAPVLPSAPTQFLKSVVYL